MGRIHIHREHRRGGCGYSKRAGLEGLLGSQPRRRGGVNTCLLPFTTGSRSVMGLNRMLSPKVSTTLTPTLRPCNDPREGHHSFFLCASRFSKSISKEKPDTRENINESSEGTKEGECSCRVRGRGETCYFKKKKKNQRVF